jgi:hypothetical protein
MKYCSLIGNYCQNQPLETDDAKRKFADSYFAVYGWHDWPACPFFERDYKTCRYVYSDDLEVTHGL